MFCESDTSETIASTFIVQCKPVAFHDGTHFYDKKRNSRFLYLCFYFFERKDVSTCNMKSDESTATAEVQTVSI